jgi:hypothetical protein
VEARKLLRLVPEVAEFGVIASTLRGAQQDTRREPSAAVSRVELAELKRSLADYAPQDGLSPPVEALRCCCEVK